METTLRDRLIELANILHWLGKYTESNILIKLSVVCTKEGLDTVEDLDKRVGQ